MVISRTPLRMSFVGGGTDFPDYYNTFTGEVVSTTIDSYITVTVEESIDNRIHLDYFFGNEDVYTIDEIEHDILRECLRYYNITGVRITITTDMPVLGSGLGSSSCLTVGILLALSKYSGESCGTQVEIADKACEIELDILKRAIGKQDQYGTAIGGCKHIFFNSQDDLTKPEVIVTRINVKEDRLIELRRNLLLFYTGVQRNATDILEEQVKNTDNNISVLQENYEMVKEFKKILTSNISLDHVGLILNECWENKKKLASSITDPFFDRIYDDVMLCGAIGG